MTESITEKIGDTVKMGTLAIKLFFSAACADSRQHLSPTQSNYWLKNNSHFINAQTNIQNGDRGGMHTEISKMGLNESIANAYYLAGIALRAMIEVWK